MFERFPEPQGSYFKALFKEVNKVGDFRKPKYMRNF